MQKRRPRRSAHRVLAIRAVEGHAFSSQMIEGRGADVRITGGRNVRVQIIADDEQDVGLLGGVRGGSRKCQDAEGENTFFHFVFILSSKGWVH